MPTTTTLICTSPDERVSTFSCTVVIPVRNRPDPLERAVNSVLSQEGDIDVEVVIVDDGSTDATPDVAARLAADHEQVRVLRSIGAGVSMARNTGIESARSPWITFLDSDDLVEPHWLSHFAAIATDDIDLVFGAAASDGRDSSDLRPHDLGPAFRHVIGLFLAGTFAVRAEVMRAVGGYAPEMAFSENTEVGLRLCRQLAHPGRTAHHLAPDLVIQGWDGRGPTRGYAPAQRGAAALALLERHPELADLAPTMRADHLAIAGVAAAHLDDGAGARRHLWRSWRANPRRLRNLARTAEASISPRRRRRWPASAPTPPRPTRGRILAVADKSPLPATTGSPQRLVHLLDALASTAPIDLVITATLDDHQREALRSRFPSARVVAAPLPRVSRVSTWWQLVRHRRPSTLAGRDFSGAQLAVAALAADAPAMVWCFGAAAHRALDGHTTAPVIVDLADLPDVWADRVARLRRDAPSGPFSSLARVARHHADRSAWKHELTGIGRHCTVAVCSNDDARRARGRDVIVVPNGTVVPDESVATRHQHTSPPPTLLFAGQLAYGPNADAACWFADEAFPALIHKVDGVRLLLVGRTGPLVDALAHRDQIEVRGEVPSMDAALAEADAVVVPLRAGSGTRLKVLEAWAHGLPVVSTTIGAEGLGAVDGRDLLIADLPRTLADACARVLTDDALRLRLIEAGRARAHEYSWTSIEADFAGFVRSRLDRTHPPR
jgi:glycosyltransferase involved in cell wall biosynthesis